MSFDYYCLGIDLGTTNSCVASCHNSPSIANPEVFTDLFGLNIIPSIVAFNDLSCLVGKNAQNEKLINPQNTFYNIKKLIGRRINDKTVKDDRRTLSYKIFDSRKWTPELHVLTKRFHDPTDPNKPLILEPEEISALVLSYLKQCANLKSDHMTNRCVITVPANFNEYQRRATKDAARIAGLDPIDVISEPTAACIMYAYTTNYKPEKRNILVYDYGGGTLDVSLVQIEGNKFTVLSTAGNSHLGGSDIDSYLCEYLMSVIKEKYGIDIHPSRGEDKYQRERAFLLSSCEEAKKHLSNTTIERIILSPFLKKEDGTTIDLDEVVSRVMIQSYINENKDKLIQPIQQVLSQSEINLDQIENVILVGGSCRIPAIQELLNNEFGKKAYFPLNADEAIAQGAALYGAIKTKSIDKINGFTDFVIQDITPMSIGIGTSNGKVDVHIPRNTPIPYKSKWIRYLCRNDVVSIPIIEGDSPERYHCHQVGSFEINVGSSEKTPIYARIEVDREKNISLFAVQSDHEPNDSDPSIKSLTIKSNQLIHTDEEITILRNKCQTILVPSVPAEEEVNLYMRLIIFLTKLSSSILPKITDRAKKPEYQNKIRTLKLNLKEKYEDIEDTMTEDEFKHLIQEAERETLTYYPEYTRLESLQAIINETGITI